MTTVLFIFGLIIGSFLNAFVYRYEKHITLRGRSFCPKCKKQIFWYDNIPVISFLLLKGKCRNCKNNISLQYPAVELLAGISFVVIVKYSESGQTISNWFNGIFRFEFEPINLTIMLNILILIVLLTITAILILIAIYDLKAKEIPNGFSLTFILMSSIYLLTTSFNQTNNPQIIIFNLLTGTFLFFIFGSLVYFSKETIMGGGDAKFVLSMGLLLGPTASLLAIMVASISGSVYGLYLIQKQKSKSKKPSHEVPFGPFLALGTYISLVFSTQIINWYAKIFIGI